MTEIKRFFVCPFGGGGFKKLFETKTLVLVFKVDFNPKPRFGVEKLKSFYWLDGFYKNNQAINEQTNEQTKRTIFIYRYGQYYLFK